MMLSKNGFLASSVEWALSTELDDEGVRALGAGFARMCKEAAAGDSVLVGADCAALPTQMASMVASVLLREHMNVHLATSTFLPSLQATNDRLGGIPYIMFTCPESADKPRIMAYASLSKNLYLTSDQIQRWSTLCNASSEDTSMGALTTVEGADANYTRNLMLSPPLKHRLRVAVRCENATLYACLQRVFLYIGVELCSPHNAQVTFSFPTDGSIVHVFDRYGHYVQTDKIALLLAMHEGASRVVCDTHASLLFERVFGNAAVRAPVGRNAMQTAMRHAFPQLADIGATRAGPVFMGTGDDSIRAMLQVLYAMDDTRKELDILLLATIPISLCTETEVHHVGAHRIDEVMSNVKRKLCGSSAFAAREISMLDTSDGVRVLLNDGASALCIRGNHRGDVHWFAESMNLGEEYALHNAAHLIVDWADREAG